MKTFSNYIICFHYICVNKYIDYLCIFKNIILENNAITYDEIVHRLGTPKDVIMDYYDQQDIYEIIKKAKLTKNIKKLIIIFLIIISIFLTYKTYIYQKTYEEVKNSSNGYFEEVIE